jgi:hypothetical protein
MSKCDAPFAPPVQREKIGRVWATKETRVGGSCAGSQTPSARLPSRYVRAVKKRENGMVYLQTLLMDGNGGRPLRTERPYRQAPRLHHMTQFRRRRCGRDAHTHTAAGRYSLLEVDGPRGSRQHEASGRRRIVVAHAVRLRLDARLRDRGFERSADARIGSRARVLDDR